MREGSFYQHSLSYYDLPIILGVVGPETHDIDHVANFASAPVGRASFELPVTVLNPETLELWTVSMLEA